MLGIKEMSVKKITIECVIPAILRLHLMKQRMNALANIIKSLLIENALVKIQINILNLMEKLVKIVIQLVPNVMDPQMKIALIVIIKKKKKNLNLSLIFN